MCAIMNRFRRISAAARHRPVFDCESRFCCSQPYGCPQPPQWLARGIDPCFFSSGLTQPLFTKLANLLENTLSPAERAMLPPTTEGRALRARVNRVCSSVVQASQSSALHHPSPPESSSYFQQNRHQIFSTFPLLQWDTRERYCGSLQRVVREDPITVQNHVKERLSLHSFSQSFFFSARPTRAPPIPLRRSRQFRTTRTRPPEFFKG